MSTPPVPLPSIRDIFPEMSIRPTVEDILKNVPRFRILCIGDSGVGKSSLIYRVFGIAETKLSECIPGEAIIGQEFVSDENKHIVFHDFGGIGPCDDTAFDSAARFLRKKHGMELNDQVHAIWFFKAIHFAGGRVLEAGDEELLQLVHELQIHAAMMEELEREENIDEETLYERGTINAGKLLAAIVDPVERLMAKLDTPTFPHVAVSVAQGHENSIANLVDMTCKIVTRSVQGDALAIAQRTNLLMKIRVSVKMGLNYYYHTLTGESPGVRQLWQCIAQIHQDIVTCWNVKDDDEILRGIEFQQLMLYLVEGLHTQSPTTTSTSPDKIGRFVNLITTNIPTAPPVVTLGISYDFVKWISDAKIERVPKVECLLMAYIVDLNSVLMSLFGPPLKPRLARRTNWKIIKEVLEDYARSNKHKENHASCQSMYDRNAVPSKETLWDMTIQLLEKSLGLDIRESLLR